MGNGQERYTLFPTSALPESGFVGLISACLAPQKFHYKCSMQYLMWNKIFGIVMNSYFTLFVIVLIQRAISCKPASSSVSGLYPRIFCAFVISAKVTGISP